MNIYVPERNRDLLDRLRRLSARTGKPINRLVLEAISDYLRHHAPLTPAFRTFDLGLKGPWERADLYEKRLDKKVGQK
ncbi:MAG: ribbon-helix-helix domain-containing protein [Caldiserica bacterium]|nr:ribbon-helix-helix domain-containing protein [Caldisericota bacterium]